MNLPRAAAPAAASPRARWTVSPGVWVSGDGTGPGAHLRPAGCGAGAGAARAGQHRPQREGRGGQGMPARNLLSFKPSVARAPAALAFFVLSPRRGFALPQSWSLGLGLMVWLRWFGGIFYVIWFFCLSVLPRGGRDAAGRCRTGSSALSRLRGERSTPGNLGMLVAGMVPGQPEPSRRPSISPCPRSPPVPGRQVPLPQPHREYLLLLSAARKLGACGKLSPVSLSRNITPAQFLTRLGGQIARFC